MRGMSVRSLQERFRAYLLDGSSDIAEELDRDGDAGLAVYHNAYRAQLLACLRDTFERVWAWLGDEAFDAAARTHITANPPRSWTLSDYGKEFSQTLGRLYPSDPECAELAALDWHMRRAFDGPDCNAVEINALDGINWDRAVFRFVPTLRILPITTNCGAIWSAVATGSAPPRAELLPVSAAMRIWRSGLSPTFCTIDATEQRAISLAMEGASFAVLCKALAAETDESHAVENGGRLLAAWLQDRLLAAIDA